MADDTRYAPAWHQVALRWGLAPDQLPGAIMYLCTVLRAAEGQLQAVEIQYRPEGERYVYRYTDPALGEQRIVANRPPQWDEQLELQAIEDVCIALTHGFAEELGPGDVQAA